MSQPILLDLFCGAGGASMGYHRAGFKVVGIDINPQPHYPFDFYQEDAMIFLKEATLSDWDIIHASPPCQRYSPISRYQRVAMNYPDLVDEVRTYLLSTKIPYVIENVPNAPLRKDLILCGQQFDLPIYRHRVFESSIPLQPPPPCIHIRPAKSNWSGYATLADGIITVVGHTYRVREGRIAMGIPWMTQNELNESIPPAYTEYIGNQLIKAVINK